MVRSEALQVIEEAKGFERGGFLFPNRRKGVLSDATEGRWAICKEQDLGQPLLLIARCLSLTVAVSVWLGLTAVEADH
jgi:hypothetical protein